ncbi:putative transcriptional regulator [Singulisphaera sp. GP187]|nr:putative transcriptional regulator [Singulisphaera sp. GP187]
MLSDMELLRDTIAEGVPIEDRFTVRRVEMVPPPREYCPDDVRRVRDLMGMSQGVFALFLGVDSGTISAWEQGRRKPTGTARRLMDEIEADTTHWRVRIHSLVKPKTGGSSCK